VGEIAMSVQLKPETEARLTALAAATGVSVDDYLAALVEKEGSPPPSPPESSGTQFQKEHGIWVYRTGVPMPCSLVDDTLEAIRRQREERSFGNLTA
jgi:hypothetical protein